jgi:hypothetical protein
MILICNEQGKFIVSEHGEDLVKSRNLSAISEYLNEERPEEVEAHLFNGNSLKFEIELRDEEILKNLIFQQFKRNNEIFLAED